MLRFYRSRQMSSLASSSGQWFLNINRLLFIKELHTLKPATKFLFVILTPRKTSWCQSAAKFYASSQKLTEKLYGMEEIRKFLNISEVEAQIYFKKGSITKRKLQNLKHMAAFFQSVNLNPRYAMNYGLQNCDPFIVEQRYYCLHEMGITRITPETLLRFREIRNRTVAELNSLDMLSTDIHPLEFYQAAVDGPPNLDRILNDETHKGLRDGPVEFIYRAILIEYLVWKLESHHQQVLNILKKYPLICRNSFHSLRQILKVLTSDVGFTYKKIKDNGFLLCRHASKVSHMLNEVPKLGGIDTREHFRKFPRLLITSIDHLKDIEVTLKAYDITPEQISKHSDIYSLCPNTISTRLRQLESNEQLKMLKSHSRYLHLVYYLPKIMNRLDILNENKIPVSINFLTTSESRFHQLIASEKERFLYEELKCDLAKALGSTRTVVQRKLHNHFLNVINTPKENIYQVLELLEKYQIPKSFILKNIFLLFTNSKKLQSLLEKIKNGDISLELDKHGLPDSAVRILSDKKNYLTSNLHVGKVKYGRETITECLSLEEYLKTKC